VKDIDQRIRSIIDDFSPITKQLEELKLAAQEREIVPVAITEPTQRVVATTESIVAVPEPTQRVVATTESIVAVPEPTQTVLPEVVRTEIEEQVEEEIVGMEVHGLDLDVSLVINLILFLNFKIKYFTYLIIKT
jgi:hypothetical protein